MPIMIVLALAFTFIPTTSYFPEDTATVISDQIGSTALATHGDMNCAEADAAFMSAESNLYWMQSYCGPIQHVAPLCGVMIDLAQQEVVDAALARAHACGY